MPFAPMHCPNLPRLLLVHIVRRVYCGHSGRVLRNRMPA
jgi:hypothetical protein